MFDGWGSKSTVNLLSAVRAVVEGSGGGDGVGLLQFIYSLGIHHVGINFSRLVAGRYGTVDHFMEAIE